MGSMKTLSDGRTDRQTDGLTDSAGYIRTRGRVLTSKLVVDPPGLEKKEDNRGSSESFRAVKNIDFR